MLRKIVESYKKSLNEYTQSDDPWKNNVSLNDFMKETGNIVSTISSVALASMKIISSDSSEHLESDGWRDGHSGFGFYMGDHKIDE